MRAKRGVAQVVFSFLPDQTADLSGRSWRVDKWTEPRTVYVDHAALRAELTRAAWAWAAAGKDDGLVEDLRAGAEVTVIAPSEDGGVAVMPFPEAYRCNACGRIEGSIEKSCCCGAGSWRQLPFVSYHDCGFSDTPWIPRCKQHNQVALRSLGRTAATSSLDFYCPVCKKQTAQGFPFVTCQCGTGKLKYNVHRAAAVYTPRSTVIINPPTQQRAAELQAPGARDAILAWTLDGMDQDEPLGGPQNAVSLYADLVAKGIPEAVAQEMADLAVQRSGGAVAAKGIELPDLEPELLASAHEGALQLAYATGGGRARVSGLIERAAPAMRVRYEHRYPDAFRRAGMLEVELLDSFPVLDAVYGYTRDSGSPTITTLRPFRGKGTHVRVHGQLSSTEALLFRLDPATVGRWLARRDLFDGDPSDGVAVRSAVLARATIPRAGEVLEHPTVGSEVLELVHSLAHRVMRRASSFAGIDRDSLSEYLVPAHLCFIVFAASRGDFVLGGLQALFEHDLDHMLQDVVAGERRCALDPGCSSHGGACVACLHVGEPSCRYFNGFLSREAIFGAKGYFDV